MNQLKSLGGIPELRQGTGKAGPVVTDNGNFILDTNFGLLKDPYTLQQDLIKIPGIIETGIFSKMANTIYIGKLDGSVECRNVV